MSSRRARRSGVDRIDAAGAAAAVLFLGAMVVWPLVAIGVRSTAGVGPARLVSTLVSSSTIDVLGFTLWQAALSTIGTLVIGLPIAHALTRHRFPGRDAVRAFTVVPFVLPTVVVAAAFSALFERVGLRGVGSLSAIVLAHVFFNVAVVVRVVGGHWATLDRSAEAAAAVLGARPRQVFTAITLRRLGPVVAGAALLVFLFCFTSYGIILVLGGPTVATLETEIRRYAIFRQEFDVAAVLAFVQLVVVVALSVGVARFQRRTSVATTGRRLDPGLPLTRPLARLHLFAVGALIAAVIGAPIAALVIESLRVGNAWTLDHYAALVEPIDLLPVSPARSLWQSLRVAAAAAVVATVIGVPAARVIAFGRRGSRWLEAVVLVPLGVSAATLGFGYLLAFAAFDLRRSPLLLPLAHAVVALPFVIAGVVPALRAIDPHVRESAAVLGATPLRVLATIEWPAARRAVATGAGFAVAISLGEFGATSFVSRGDASFTAPLAVFRLLSQPGETLRGQAMALSVIIGIVVAALAALLERLRGNRPGAL